ncbi:hypothetical protein [Streptomyces pseudoechinosporeus]
MLSEAHRRVERGTDCVVAFVEHHDRPRTEVMLHGLEQIPRRELDYRDTVFTEMDVDAVLKRRPAVALVDELAHTNVPGSRNPKRCQDVGELLDAGIDVITTVNMRTKRNCWRASRKAPTGSTTWWATCWTCPGCRPAPSRR